MGKDNKIYVGGQDDFDWFSLDKNAKLKFTSLKILLFEKNYSFTDVWHIVAYDDVF